MGAGNLETTSVSPGSSAFSSYGRLLPWENITQNGKWAAIFFSVSAIDGIVRACFLSEKNTNYSKKRGKLCSPHLHQMTEELRVWWLSLQPSECLPHNEDYENCSTLLWVPLDMDDWSGGAVNGVYGIVVCLAWWLEADCHLGRKFNYFIEDVLWVVHRCISLPVLPPDSQKLPSHSQQPPSRSQRTYSRCQ